MFINSLQNITKAVLFPYTDIFKRFHLTLYRCTDYKFSLKTYLHYIELLVPHSSIIM